jgi:hypothetical protein
MAKVFLYAFDPLNYLSFFVRLTPKYGPLNEPQTGAKHAALVQGCRLKGN